MATQQLLDYIRQQLAAGVAKEQIKAALATQGWNEQDLSEAFAAFEKAPPVSTPQAPTSPPIAQPAQQMPVINKTSVALEPVMSMWSKGIPRTNWTFMVISLLLVFGLDLFILVSSPMLWPFWVEMLAVFVVFSIFLCLENYVFSRKFTNTRSALDPWIAGIIVARNLIFLLNFIPLIQVLGMVLLGGFLAIIQAALLGGSGGFGIGGLSGLGVTSLIMPVLLILYIVLIVRRFSSVKQQATN